MFPEVLLHWFKQSGSRHVDALKLKLGFKKRLVFDRNGVSVLPPTPKLYRRCVPVGTIQSMVGKACFATLFQALSLRKHLTPISPVCLPSRRIADKYCPLVATRGHNPPHQKITSLLFRCSSEAEGCRGLSLLGGLFKVFFLMYLSKNYDAVGITFKNMYFVYSLQQKMINIAL